MKFYHVPAVGASVLENADCIERLQALDAALKSMENTRNGQEGKWSSRRPICANVIHCVGISTI